MIILKEFLENAIVEKIAMKRGGREIMEPKNSASSIELSEITTNHPIRAPLAAPVKRQAAKAVRNLPPKSPSSGPEGWITRQTPSSSNLEKSKKY